MDKIDKKIIAVIVIALILMILINSKLTGLMPLSEPLSQIEKDKESKTIQKIESESILLDSKIKAEIIKPTKIKVIKLFEKINECPFIQRYELKIINEGNFRIEKPIIESKGIALSNCINCNLNFIEKEITISFNGCKKEEKALIEIKAINAESIQLSFN
jgi:hypothetical protein